MTAQEKLDRIIELTNKGATIILSTHLKAWRVKKSTIEKFMSAGVPLFKVKNNSIYMRQGKEYVCADYMAIRAYQ